MSELKLTVTNLHCAACVKACISMIKKISSVTGVGADEKTGIFTVVSSSPVDFRLVQRRLAEKGYRAIENRVV